MTLPSMPFRSSPDADALDTALNNRASNSSEHVNLASEIAADAIDIHRWADDVLRSDPAATGPAAGTWNRVLRETTQATPRRRNKMSSAALSSQPEGYRIQPNETMGAVISKYSKLVATLAIVFAVTVGGWFAMSQTPGGGNGRFAALQSTPEVAQSQTCDVEPLTVDEVIAIVENPYSTLDSSWWGTPIPGEEADESNQIQNQELLESPTESIPYPGSGASFTVPDTEDFEGASEFMETLQSCTSYGTIGQMWAIQSPLTIQNEVLTRFPVYRDRSEVRSHIESMINEPYPYGDSEVYPDLQLSANPRMGDARIWASENPFGLDYTKVIYIGVQAVDSNGITVVAENFEGTAVDGDLERGNGVAYILVYSESTDQWFFYAAYAPRG